jgi:superfamily II DNA or RNA helicase
MNQLRPHQQKIVDTAPDKYGLFLKMRVGKTATAIRLAASRATSALVIVPKSLKEQWEEEIVRWNNSNTKFYVITKETFRRDWDKLPKFDAEIIDECHLGFANFKSLLWKSIDGYNKKHSIGFIWLLSGTPYTSSSWSVYSLGRLLGKDWKWYSWKSRFFNDIKMGQRLIPVQKKGIEKEISEIINRIGVTMSLSDISEQADDEYVKEYFDLNKEQRDAIKEAFDPLPIVSFTRYHQIESASLRGDGYTEGRTFVCDKTRRLLEIIQGNRKIAVIARYNLQLELYRSELSSQSYTGRIFLINGDTKDKNSIIKEIESCEDCVVLINSMCSAGYSLASIDTMVFASMDFSFVNYTQMVNRIKNMDKNKSCTYIHLLTRDTKDYKSVDNAVYNAVSNKQDFDVAIFAK